VTGISPLNPPYAPDVQAQLEAMMPPGVPPILLFRTFVRNMPMARAMHEWGSYELGRQLSLTMRDREIVINRTCARCRCEYEWGVHVMLFAQRVALTAQQIASLTVGGPADDCWSSARDRLLVRATDELHDTATIDDQLCAELEAELGEAGLLDLLLLCGWYHAISFAANGARTPREPGAPAFAS